MGDQGKYKRENAPPSVSSGEPMHITPPEPLTPEQEAELERQRELFYQYTPEMMPFFAAGCEQQLFPGWRSVKITVFDKSEDTE